MRGILALIATALALYANSGRAEDGFATPPGAPAPVVEKQPSIKPDIRILRDTWVVRRDAQGTELWRVDLHKGADSRPAMQIVTSNGDLAVVMNSDGCTGPLGGGQCWMVVLNPQGAVLWDGCYTPDSTRYRSYCTDLFELPDGRFLLAGWSGFGDHQAWLLCLSQSGNVLWSRTHNALPGRNTRDMMMGATLCADGGAAMAGYVTSREELDQGWILKADRVGREEWLHTYGGRVANHFFGVTAMAEGHLLAVGERTLDPTLQLRPDGWVVEVDSRGNVVRERTFGKSCMLRFFEVTPDPDGGYLLRGETGTKDAENHDTTPILMKLSATGDSLWSRRLGSEIEWHDSLFTADSCYYHVGWVDK